MCTQDDLCSTLVNRFAMQQGIRAMFNEESLPEELHGTMTRFWEAFGSGAKGTLLHDTLGAKETSGADEPMGGHRARRSQDRLPDDLFALLKLWLATHDDLANPNDIVPFVENLKELSDGAVTYATYETRPGDSNIVFKSITHYDWQAGRIRQIFRHSSLREDKLFCRILLVVDGFVPLVNQHALQDPCRAFPVAGGRLFYDRFLPQPIILTIEDIYGHFASRRRKLSVDDQSLDCLHVLPLDKVC